MTPKISLGRLRKVALVTSAGLSVVLIEAAWPGPPVISAIAPTLIGSAGRVNSPIVAPAATGTVAPALIPSTGTVGLPTVASGAGRPIVTPPTLGSDASVGVPSIAASSVAVIAPVSLASGSAVNVATVSQSISVIIPSAIVSSSMVGGPSIQQTGVPTTAPTSIASTASVGTPMLTLALTYLPTLSVAYGPLAALVPLTSPTTYSGRLATACSLSAGDGTPATLVDIPNSGDDAAAVAAFGVDYAIFQYFDQSGQGLHYKPQTTASLRRQVCSTSSVGKRSSLPRDAIGRIELPDAFATSRQNSALFMVMGGPNGYEGNDRMGLGSLGTVDVSAAAQLLTAASGGDGGLRNRTNVEQTSGLALDHSPALVGMTLFASATKFYRGQQTASFAAASAATMAGGYIGSSPFHAAGRFQRLYAAIPFAAVPTDADIAALTNALATMFGITQRTVNLIYEGDSIACGVGCTKGRNALYYIDPLLTTSAHIYNFGQGGRSVQDIASGRAAGWFTARFRADLAKNVYLCNAGVNDINGNATSTQVTDAITTIVGRAKAAGFTTGWQTILSFGFGAGTAKDTVRLAVNSWLRSNAAALGIYLVDHGDNPTYTLDGTNHPSSEGGYSAIGPVVAAKLNAVLV